MLAMDRQRRSRYVLAVYLVVLSLAVILILAGLFFVTLTSAVNKQFGNLRERLAQGATLRLLIADPDSLALEMSAERSEVPEDVGYYLKRLEATLKDLSYLERGGFGSERQDMQRAGMNRGSFAVRLLPYAPSFGIYRFETAAGKGDVLVEPYTHASGYVNPPIFALTPESDGVWYDYFAKQFDDMWQRARPWTPGRNVSRIVRQPSSRRSIGLPPSPQMPNPESATTAPCNSLATTSATCPCLPSAPASASSGPSNQRTPPMSPICDDH
jgi:hypothetical protein